MKTIPLNPIDNTGKVSAEVKITSRNTDALVHAMSVMLITQQAHINLLLTMSSVIYSGQQGIETTAVDAILLDQLKAALETANKDFNRYVAEIEGKG